MVKFEGDRCAHRDHARRRTPCPRGPGWLRPSRDLRAAEAWFLAHGLPYFVDDIRADVRARLSRRRSAPSRLVAVVLAALVGGSSGGRPRSRGGLTAGVTAVVVVWLALRRAGAARPADRAVGPEADLRQPGAAVPDGDACPAAAAALRDVPLHQHRGLAGRARPSTAACCGARCCCSRWSRSASCSCGCPRRSTGSTTTSTPTRSSRLRRHPLGPCAEQAATRRRPRGDAAGQRLRAPT